MKIIALLANNAGLGEDDGLLYLRGGGWEFALAPQFPWNLSGYIAGIAEREPDELENSILVNVTVSHADPADGHVPLSSGSMIIHGPRARIPFVMQFNVAMQQVGTLNVRLSGQDEQTFVELLLPVRLNTPPN